MWVKLNNRKTGKNVADYAEASAYLLAEQERIGYRGPNDKVWPRSASIFDKQGIRIVAHVSQNGKVWPGKEWVSGAEPLFVPGMSVPNDALQQTLDASL